jgi:hypothetical protein
MKNYLAQLGNVAPPPGYTAFGGADPAGLSKLLSIALRTLIVIAGIYALFNFIFAGYAYLSSAGDPKAAQNASSKITQSVIGLTVAAGAFVIAGIVGQILFQDPNALLQITIFSP